MMLGMHISLMVVVWMLLGVIPCRLFWYHTFKEQPSKFLVVVSAIFGPILGVAHFVGWCIAVL
ncbi:MAG: hypothetical protein IMZ47_04230 [Firmicutes bacterium]|nr:hypothetical protein [Bacillota bacterium]